MRSGPDPPRWDNVGAGLRSLLLDGVLCEYASREAARLAPGLMRVPVLVRPLERTGDRDARWAARRSCAQDLAGAAASEDVLAKYRKAKEKVGAVYTLDDHPSLKGQIRPLFDEFRRRVTNLDAGANALEIAQARCEDRQARRRARWRACCGKASSRRPCPSWTSTQPTSSRLRRERGATRDGGGTGGARPHAVLRPATPSAFSVRRLGAVWSERNCYRDVWDPARAAQRVVAGIWAHESPRLGGAECPHVRRPHHYKRFACRSESSGASIYRASRRRQTTPRA